MRKKIVTLIVACTIISFETQRPEYYQDLVEQKVNEIISIISHSTSDTVTDCRTYFIDEGNACGPFFVYGTKNIDTALLMRKFVELGEIKQDYYNKMDEQGTPQAVCDLAFPDTLLIMNEKCRACFKVTIDECKDTSVLYY